MSDLDVSRMVSSGGSSPKGRNWTKSMVMCSCMCESCTKYQASNNIQRVSHITLDSKSVGKFVGYVPSCDSIELKTKRHDFS